MKKREKVLWALAGLLLLVSVLSLTVVPGIRFSGLLTLALAGVCILAVFLGRWAEKSRAGKRCQRIFLAGLSAALLLFLLVEGLLLSHGERDHSALPADAVIVLGAGVNGETPSLMLQSRINAAAEYLNAHPDIPAVLSGGQGNGENITEAECMRRQLTAMGIGESRLLLEERSTSTAENFAFSKEVLRQAGIDPETAVVAVVTNDFHCFRAHLIAQREGLTVLDVPAEVPWLLLNANYYVREFFALGKTLIFD
ncbi:MAG: YdcF family protein [Dysosmobacter sp.]|nr:YdcF family protein [Dysosmobacter sp.]